MEIIKSFQQHQLPLGGIVMLPNKVQWASIHNLKRKTNGGETSLKDSELIEIQRVSKKPMSGMMVI